MFVGHAAVALAAKSRLPHASFAACVAAAFALDLLCPFFLLLGVERVAVDPGNTKFTPLAFESYPWTHSLMMALAWGLVGLAAVQLSKGTPRFSMLVLILVVSHWLLDFVSHRPDLPLWPGDSPKLGLGLWNSIGGTLAFEGAMFGAGILLYIRATKAIDWVGSIGSWLLVCLSTLMWAGQPWSPPPPSVRSVAWFSLGVWLLPLWAGWGG